MQDSKRSAFTTRLRRAGARPPGGFWLLWCMVVAFAASLVVLAAGSARAASQEGSLLAYEYRMAGNQERTRIVVNFDREPEVNWFLLRGPHRLVIDLPETDFSIDEEQTAPRGLVGRVRYGRMGEGHSRMIFTADGPFALDDLAVLQNETSPGYRLIIDLVAASEGTFEAAMRSRLGQAPEAGTADRAHRPDLDEERFTVVLDPGHGGIDGGARGVTGTYEKTITLAFALELRNKLEEAGGYNVILTRETDIFLRLDERVRIARENDADLLVSIHADSIGVSGFGGATVYTLSDRASDAAAAARAARENLSDSLAGMVVEEEKDEVTDILVDLIRRETQTFSIRFARTLVGELSGSIDLVPNPLRAAGFRVLRAPEVPSVLLELGYLSNPKEEEQMRDAGWRAQAAEKVVTAIGAFAAAKAGAGG